MVWLDSSDRKAPSVKVSVDYEVGLSSILTKPVVIPRL